ncbi:MerR family transcriptional regulator [Deinococcus sp.]|uniref:MerR family transcriptional regulator n=1 Tax=Deinococcus sp. TaxID=47478 RepID=UPI003C7A57FA
MSVQTLPETWSGDLDELAGLANRLLPGYLPLDRPPSRTGLSKPSRAPDEVNPRLIRHYTTLGLLDAPLREGREARYTRRHLLQLLTLRRLMSEGYSAQSLQGLLEAQNDPGLEALLLGQSRLQVQTSSPALAYLQSLKAPPSILMSSNPRRSPAPVESEPFDLVASPAPALKADPPPMPSPQPLREPLPARYTRLPLAPGLELHVGRDARLPRTAAEQDALARQVVQALEDLRRIL